MRVVVVGMGHVGAVTAACLAHDGHQVVCMDADPNRQTALERGMAPVDEPGLQTMFAQQVEAGRLVAADDVAQALAGADVVIVAVGTPARPDGMADLSQVLDAARTIGSSLAPDASPVVALRSTVPPGTTEGCFADAIAAAAGGRQIDVVHLPEFFREGSAIADWTSDPYLVVGCSDDAAGDRIEELLGAGGRNLHRTNIRTAEALKYACNAWHATKVAFANEIGRWGQAAGADPGELARLFTADRKLNLGAAYLQPGFAYGGPCLAKDLNTLVVDSTGRRLDLPLLAHTAASNEATLDWWVDRIRATGVGDVALLGLVHRSGSRDLRVSPYLVLADRLASIGIRPVVYEPALRSLPVLPHRIAATLEQAVGRASLVLRSRHEVASLEEIRAAALSVPVIDLFRLGTPTGQVLA